jgi:hypothetical protein
MWKKLLPVLGVLLCTIETPKLYSAASDDPQPVVATEVIESDALRRYKDSITNESMTSDMIMNRFFDLSPAERNKQIPSFIQKLIQKGKPASPALIYTSKLFNKEHPLIKWLRNADPDKDEALKQTLEQFVHNTPLLDEQSAHESSTETDETPRMQFIILIDEKKQETPESALNNMAVTRAFTIAFGMHDEFPQVPFLVSKSIVSNFIFRNARADITNDRSLIGSPKWDTWQIYEVNDTQFLLFLPTDSLFKGIQMPSAENLTPLPSDAHKLALRLKDHSEMPPFQPEQLKKVFKTRNVSQEELPVWDILFFGHGQSAPPAKAKKPRLHFNFKKPIKKTPIIGGVTIPTMQKLLTFFNTNMSLGTLFIESCEAGGTNSILLQFKEEADQKILMTLHFTVIIGSISDSQTTLNEFSHLKWKEFFKKTNRPLNELITLLSTTYRTKIPFTNDPFASSNIPQFWIPGGYGFQTYQADKRIKILSKTLVAAHEDENRPIIIPETAEVVLVYPQTIGVPVIITNPKIQFISMIKDKSSPAPNFVSIHAKDDATLIIFLMFQNPESFTVGGSLSLKQSISSALIARMNSSSQNAESSAQKMAQSGTLSDEKEAIESIAQLPTTKKLSVNALITKMLKKKNNNIQQISKEYFLSERKKNSDFQVQDLPMQLQKAFKGVSIHDLITHELIPEGTHSLDLSSLYIHDLSGLSTLKNVQDIEELSLLDNRISAIHRQDFAGFENLKELILTNNHIKIIESNSFTPLINLKLLDIGDIQLTQIHSDAFAGLGNLEILDISNNPITNVQKNAFRGLSKNLKMLNMVAIPPKIQQKISAEIQKIAPNARTRSA